MKNRSLLKLLLSATLLVTASTTTLSAAAPMQQKQSKPFLIQGKLPHLTMLVKQMWNDKDLALTPKQKTALVQIRKTTMNGIAPLKKEINSLEAKIVNAANSGTNPAELKEDLLKLAKLRAEATMIHLQCIYNTKKVLTKDQLDILL